MLSKEQTFRLLDNLNIDISKEEKAGNIVTSIVMTEDFKISILEHNSRLKLQGNIDITEM